MQASLTVYASTFVQSCSSLFESRVLTSHNPQLVHQNTSSSPISVDSSVAKQSKFSREILCSSLRQAESFRLGDSWILNRQRIVTQIEIDAVTIAFRSRCLRCQQCHALVLWALARGEFVCLRI